MTTPQTDEEKILDIAAQLRAARKRFLVDYETKTRAETAAIDAVERLRSSQEEVARLERELRRLVYDDPPPDPNDPLRRPLT